MKLYQRVLLAPGLAILCLGAFAAVASRALGTQQTATEEIFKTRFAYFERATQASSEIDAAHALAYRVVTWIGTYDERKLASASAEIRRRVDLAASLAKQLSDTPGLTAKERELLGVIVTDVARYGKSVAQAIDFASVDVNSGLAAMQTADLAFQDLRTRVDALVAVETELARERYDEAERAGQAATRLAWIVLLLAAAGAAAAGLAVARAVSRQIGGEPEYAAEIARRVAQGDLTVSIEAARAGAHGKGFAVVATEVRRLAETSQGAAKQISELAASSLGLAERTGGLLAALVPSIRQTAGLVQQVTAASQAQSTGVAQLNASMTQVNQITQRNAVAAEELGSTAEEMATQAASLERQVAWFRVTEGVRATPRVRQPALPA